ncbi:MAG TPA: hypothetical protein DCE76_00410 [Anaerolineaceae bacterium]|nr:hypothetical protein [Anaerolineaceae bacterium]
MKIFVYLFGYDYPAENRLRIGSDSRFNLSSNHIRQHRRWRFQRRFGKSRRQCNGWCQRNGWGQGYGGGERNGRRGREDLISNRFRIAVNRKGKAAQQNCREDKPPTARDHFAPLAKIQ